MYGNRVLWLTLLTPAAVIGMLLGGAVYANLQSVVATAWMVFGCLVVGLTTAYLVAHQQQNALAQIRRPELRDPRAQGLGLFRTVLSPALEVLQESEFRIEEAKKTQTELEARSCLRRQQLRQLESTVDSLEWPILVLNAHGHVQWCNPASRQLFAAANGEPSADHPAEVNLSLFPEIAKLVKEALSRRETSATRTMQWRHAPEGKEATLYRIRAVNLYESERYVGLMVVFKDIHDEQQANTRHAEFVSSVAHEMKTPMASMKAYLEMLIDGDAEDEEERQEFYGFIDGQIDRLTRMVNNMLNLARIQSGVIKVQREDCELNDVLQGAFEVVEPTAGEKQIQMKTELSQMYLPVHVDRDLFGQAVINLLSNAVKYTPEGGSVTIRSRMEETEAIIEVGDTGMGIPADSLPHIFERFYRVPENNKAAKGTGLGLTLVQYIVTCIHNGRIDVASEVGAGTTFTVVIPLGHQQRSQLRKEAAAAIH